MKGDYQEEIWFSLREVSERLGVSKEVVKYHRKKLSPEEQKQSAEGVWYLNELGVEKIKNHLRKSKQMYSRDELDVIRHRLQEIEFSLMMLRRGQEELLELVRGRSKTEGHRLFFED